MARIKYCSSCRRSYDGSQDEGVGPAEAEFAVKGYHKDTKRPWCANLCKGHIEVAEDDYQITEIRNLETGAVKRWNDAAEDYVPAPAAFGTRAWRVEIDGLVREYTGYRDLDHMALCNPTLRLDPYIPGTQKWNDMRRIRSAYRFVTGKEAAI